METKICLNLDDGEQVEKTLTNYLKLECPHYLKGNFISMRGICDYVFKEIIEGQDCRVLVYNVELDNQEAFGTIGGIMYPIHPPSCNVFPKLDVGDSKMAARLHLYWEGVNRYESFKKQEGGLKRLADTLSIPQKFR